MNNFLFQPGYIPLLHPKFEIHLANETAHWLCIGSKKKEDISIDCWQIYWYDHIARKIVTSYYYYE